RGEKMENIKIRDYLFENIDLEYKKFYEKLIPEEDKILGVRIPIIRKLGKKIAKNDAEKYLQNPLNYYYEEKLLQAVVIGYLDLDIEEIFSYIDGFVYKIDNWSICDTFVSSLKICKDYREETFEYLNKFIDSNKPYEIRFSIVMYIFYFIENENYLEKVYTIIDDIKSSDYYVKMAIAWAVSMGYKYHKDKTLIYLENCKLDDFTYNKAIQKIIELKGTNKDEKMYLDRKSTRLNSSHVSISYAVFCLKKKNGHVHLHVVSSRMPRFPIYSSDPLQHLLSFPTRRSSDLIAWAVSMGYKYHKDKTLIYLENCKLDDFTYNKAIQKIIELKGTNKDEKMY